jgi:hypothetical protein
MGEKIPSINAQVESIAIAFCELAKMLGKNDCLPVTQLAASLESKAKAARTSAETKTALGELARRLRNP